MRKHIWRAGLFVVAASLAAQSASADLVEDFYKSKRVTLIIGSGAGGGYDAYGRTLARHWSKHIPGNPSIVVQNMEAASGIVASNYLFNKAERDGSVVLHTHNSLVINPLFESEQILYDPLTMGWVGSSGKQTNICMTWGSSPIKTLEQATQREVIAATTGVTANTATFPSIFNRLIGTKFKLVTGYNTSGMYLALERGEVDTMCGSAYSTLMAAKPDWILEKKVNVISQFGAQKIADLPDVPLAVDSIKNPDDKKIFTLLAYPQEIGRPFVAPPGVPADRLQALRRSFDATMKDPEFLAESKKSFQFIEPLTGEQIDAMIKQAYATPKDVIAKYVVLTNAVGVKKD